LAQQDYFEMIELIQLPYSPYCIVQSRILEFAGVPFKLTNLPDPNDRSLVWKLTREQYYAVPILRDGRQVVFESSEQSQVIAKYLDAKLKLGLFPAALEGVQSILWRYIENELEGVGFKLNDIYFKEFVAPAARVAFLRHKERKFGRGCIDQWRAQQRALLAQLEQGLRPFEDMLAHQPFLLGDRPRFVDFDLYGILGNFLYTGHYQLPAGLRQVRRWHRSMIRLKPQTTRA
jgi:glutathione S-transferase